MTRATSSLAYSARTYRRPNPLSTSDGVGWRTSRCVQRQTAIAACIEPSVHAKPSCATVGRIDVPPLAVDAELRDPVADEEADTGPQAHPHSVGVLTASGRR